MKAVRIELRLPQSLKDELARRAKADGRSMNNYVEMVLSKTVKGEVK